MTDDRKMFPLRLDPDVHGDLMLLATLTGEPANSIVSGLVAGHLAGPGREAIEQAMTGRAAARYADALDQLAQS